MTKEHHYAMTTDWVGHDAAQPFTYKSYSRTHLIGIDGKPTLEMSADPSFLGDPSKLNPEDCLIAALSGCHMLSYLALAAMRKVTVVAYTDHATGVMLQEGDGGHFTEVTLRPKVTILKEADTELAHELHGLASKNCFIASSVNFPVLHKAEILCA